MSHIIIVCQCLFSDRCPARDREGQGTHFVQRRQDPDLRPIGPDGAHRQEHRFAAGSSHRPRGPQTLRCPRHPGITCQASGPVQGQEVRESQGQEGQQRLQEVNVVFIVYGEEKEGENEICRLKYIVANIS